MFGQWDGDCHYYAAQVTKYIGGNRWVFFTYVLLLKIKKIFSVNLRGRKVQLSNELL